MTAMLDCISVLLVSVFFIAAFCHLYYTDPEKERREYAEMVIYYWGARYRDVAEAVARQWLADPDKYKKVKPSEISRRFYL